MKWLFPTKKCCLDWTLLRCTGFWCWFLKKWMPNAQVATRSLHIWNSSDALGMGRPHTFTLLLTLRANANVGPTHYSGYCINKCHLNLFISEMDSTGAALSEKISCIFSISEISVQFLPEGIRCLNFERILAGFICLSWKCHKTWTLELVFPWGPNEPPLEPVKWSQLLFRLSNLYAYWLPWYGHPIIVILHYFGSMYKEMILIPC